MLRQVHHGAYLLCHGPYYSTHPLHLSSRRHLQRAQLLVTEKYATVDPHEIARLRDRIIMRHPTPDVPFQGDFYDSTTALSQVAPSS